MLTYRSSAIVGVFSAVLFVLLLFPMQARSQGLPEGVEAAVVAEYPVNIPGVEKVKLLKFTFQPGAVLKDFYLEATEFCTVTQGTFTVMNHEMGTTTVYAAGSRWSNPKGVTVTVSNPGDVPAIQWVYVLNEKG